ncbi:MAG TPA: peptidylprolyl isomerase [Burkholderiaceae bacterium]|nr:peptidylprolyl isomerase [Burkholderiaceae bacterium]
MSAVFLRATAHAFLVALVAASGLALAQSPRVTPTQPPGSTAARPAPAPAPQSTTPRTSRSLDRIVAVVNDEVITANELRMRAAIADAQLRRQKIQPPPREVLERQVLERMIVDRAQLQLARETGVRVDDGTVNAAVGRVAESNGLTVPALRQRLEADGMSFNQFREDIRQDIILNRLREREVDNRLQISDSEIDNFIAEQAGVSVDAQEVNLAQILLRVPENADSTRIEETRRRAEELLGQLKDGAEFARVAASYSNASEALQGGDLGWRSVDRIPTLFVEAIKDLKAGDVSGVVRSPNGFHILKVLGRRSALDAKLASGPVQLTHARHILLRVTDLTPEPEVKRRLEEFKGRIELGQVEFGTIARLHSVDPSGSRGGDLGWLYPGDTVPEFEKTMNALKLNEVSVPVRSPFGWHLIQVLERRTEQASGDRARMQARLALRDRKADEAYQEWLRQLRDKTYVELRLDERG